MENQEHTTATGRKITLTSETKYFVKYMKGNGYSALTKQEFYGEAEARKHYDALVTVAQTESAGPEPKKETA